MVDIKRVSVAGAGAMGRQIALNSASFGYDITLYDSFPEALKSAEAWAKQYVDGRVEKGKMTAEKASEIIAHLTFEGDLTKAVDGADLVIEAIIEDKAVKEEFFKSLSKLTRKDTILATNSSFMVSSTFAGCVDNPSRLANFHYFNPALVMKLIEVVQGAHTSQDTIDALMDFGRKTGKDPVWLRKEIDGFIANRIMRVVKNEAFYLVEQGIATAPEIDTAVEKGLNYPMGPFRLLDLVGIDVSYLASKRVLDETGEKSPGFELLKAKYEAKEWGQKTGKGFYDYSK